jgi:benzil reductase ((S)-benzoin forming)
LTDSGDRTTMTGPVVIVTGGSSGLGRALLAVAPAGSYRVDVSRSGPPDVADAHIEADLADPASWAPVAAEVELVLDRLPAADVVVVHNAGTIEPIGYAGEVDDAGYATNVLLNAAAPLVLGHHLLRLLRDRPGRRDLVLISSGAARTAYPGWSSYGAAKAAIDQWVRTVGAEQRERGGVRVVSIAPGVVATGMQALLRDTDARDFPRVERFRGLHADGSLAAPEDAARAVWAVLADPDVASGHVTDVRGR